MIATYNALMSTEVEGALWRIYRDFFDAAEKKRRWHILADAPTPFLLGGIEKVAVNPPQGAFHFRRHQRIISGNHGGTVLAGSNGFVFHDGNGLLDRQNWSISIIYQFGT